MDRFSLIMPPEDKIRPTNKLGTYGRCLRWNFADDWQPFFQNTGMPPYPRELWIPIDTDYSTAMQLLVGAAKREREKLLRGLSGLQKGIDVDEGVAITDKEAFEEMMANTRKQGLVIAPGAAIPPWRGKQ